MGGGDFDGVSVFCKKTSVLHLLMFTFDCPELKGTQVCICIVGIHRCSMQPFFGQF